MRILIIAGICALLMWFTTRGNDRVNPAERPDNDALVNYHLPLERLIDSLRIDRNALSIHIDKSDFVLSVRNEQRVVKEYPIVLGENPVDDKRMEGDRCTPEGTFHMRSKYPHKSWNKFIWIDYPTSDSWRKFKEARTSGEIPADASIGGEIGIHGVPEGRDDLVERGINWTWGCVSLTRGDIDEIYSFISTSTDIIITK